MGPPPLPPRAGSRRSFWRTPLGILAFIALSLGSLVLIGLMAFGVGIYTGHLPGNKAEPGKRLPDRVLRILADADIVEPGEQVLWYYSAALFDFLEDGNLLTDRRAISYWTSDGELTIDSVPYEEIAAVSVAWAESWLADTEITAHRRDDSEVMLVVSSEAGGDRKFHAELERRRQKRR